MNRLRAVIRRVRERVLFARATWLLKRSNRLYWQSQRLGERAVRVDREARALRMERTMKC